jgi:hypothetical protein
MAADARATTGEVAVQASKQARQQQEAVTIAREEKSKDASGRQTVGGKTFYLREGVWTDAEFKTDARLPEVTVAFNSNEYFALLKREPKLAQFFALGEKVVVVFGNRVYRVTP